MNTSIVLPLGKGSRWNDTELRYCLRSIQQYITGYGEIFIVGERPAWLRNIIHIPAVDGDKTYDKEANIFRKIMIACNDHRVSETFLFLNDDHFLLQNYIAATFPYYMDGRLTDKRTVTDYKHTLNNTLKVLDADPLYADIHCPIIYNKSAFKAVAKYDWKTKFGYCIKTLYCHANKIDGQQYPDLKINEPMRYKDLVSQLAGRGWFSVGDKAREGDLLKVLSEIYPVKSEYER